MTPTPTAIGLQLCDYLLIEQGTGKVSLIGCLSAFASYVFPATPRPFFLYADLADGNGLGTAELVVARADTGEVTYSQTQPIHFANRLQVVQYGWRIAGCTFPLPGRYVLTLRVDGEWVAQRTISLKLIEGFT